MPDQLLRHKEEAEEVKPLELRIFIAASRSQASTMGPSL